MLDHFGTELSEVAARACGRAKQSTGISIRSASPRAELPWVAAFAAGQIHPRRPWREKAPRSFGWKPAGGYLPGGGQQMGVPVPVVAFPVGGVQRHVHRAAVLLH